MNFSGQIKTRELEVFSTMPPGLRAPRQSSGWADANKPGQALDAFIEGPTFLPDGRLAVTDIPYGRILTITPGGDWEVISEFDGEPNGMALDTDGSVIIADYVRGLLRLDIASGEIEPILSRRNGEGFKGLNDVARAPDGAVFFTDQGQTGLHDQSGRVYRLHNG
jgi:gluconolactonase